MTAPNDEPIGFDLDGYHWDVDVALWIDEVCQDARHATPTDLAAAGFVPLAALQAAEAERDHYRATLCDALARLSPLLGRDHAVVATLRTVLKAAAPSEPDRPSAREPDWCECEEYGQHVAVPCARGTCPTLRQRLDAERTKTPSDRAQVAEDRTPLPVESVATDPARASAGPDSKGSAGSGGEVGFVVGQRVRDKRHCCVGTVHRNDLESKLGYVLEVDWGGGRRNTQHPDDLEPAPSSPSKPDSSEQGGQGPDFLTRDELVMSLRVLAAPFRNSVIEPATANVLRWLADELEKGRRG